MEIEPKVNYELFIEKLNDYYFSFLLQPLDYNLPVMTLHLQKSDIGHISVKEAFDIKRLLNKINEHPHFKVQYFAADGESGLNKTKIHHK